MVGGRHSARGQMAPVGAPRRGPGPRGGRGPPRRQGHCLARPPSQAPAAGAAGGGGGLPPYGNRNRGSREATSPSDRTIHPMGWGACLEVVIGLAPSLPVEQRRLPLVPAGRRPRAAASFEGGPGPNHSCFHFHRLMVFGYVSVFCVPPTTLKDVKIYTQTAHGTGQKA